ncbi:hypothetical protein BESB_048430 [Besnoitia besnoiti]|uniref:Uncharacterized protein n=1 Tax=Besnoitia besnoiti TaxID=94643 RepID=A0A2A9MK58_BESBE|nr:hypothetical protein BESB_048430 [Besnoitia besnoiti]PFH36651.1 hypothetical protein BESB_048430 [Besnoitia besnoiti]
MAANAQCAAARLQSAAPIGSRVSAPAAHAPASNRTESSVHTSRNDDLGKRRIQTKTSGPRKPASLPLLSLKGQWICGECDKTCIVIREECRCLCGHRLKEHTKGVAAALEGATKFGCTNGKCGCRDFFYIVAEGAWILRSATRRGGIDLQGSPGQAQHGVQRQRVKEGDALLHTSRMHKLGRSLGTLLTSGISLDPWQEIPLGY